MYTNRNRNASLLPHWAYLRTHLLGHVLSPSHSANILDLLAHRQVRNETLWYNYVKNTGRYGKRNATL